MGVLKTGKAKKGGAQKKRRLHFREQKENGGTFKETVGADLRLARMNLGLSIEDIAGHLKIKPAHVRAIEESDFDALPGKTYAIGFVRSYSDLMALRSDEYIRRFKAEMTGAEELKFNSITAKDKKKPFPVGQFITAAVTVVLAVTVWRTGDMTLRAGGDVLEAFKPSPPGTIVVEETTARILPEAVKLAPSTDLPSGMSTADAVKLVGEGEAPVVYGQGDGEVLPLAITTKLPTASPGSTLSTGEVAAADAVSSLPDGTFWGSENHDARLRVKALDDVWLRIVVEGRVMFERVLKAGDSYAPPNSDQTLIATRNAGGLEIYVDDKFVRRLGGKDEALASALLDPDALIGGN